MLKLTKKADYGLIALKHLAGVRAGLSASAKEIADHYGIPLPVLSKVLQKLTREGLLQAEYGTNGGYRLARNPCDISALQVIRAIDGPLILTSCFTKDRDCHHSVKCSVREPLRKIHERILGVLQSITMAEISEGPDRAMDSTGAADLVVMGTRE